MAIIFITNVKVLYTILIVHDVQVLSGTTHMTF